MDALSLLPHSLSSHSLPLSLSLVGLNKLPENLASLCLISTARPAIDSLAQCALKFYTPLKYFQVEMHFTFSSRFLRNGGQCCWHLRVLRPASLQSLLIRRVDHAVVELQNALAMQMMPYISAKADGRRHRFENILKVGNSSTCLETSRAIVTVNAYRITR